MIESRTWAQFALGLSLGGLALTAGAVQPAEPGDAAASLDPRLEKLAWMRGTWLAHQGGDVLEEIWSAPAGDSLMGMFRWAKQGKAWMFELITVTADDHGVVFRLKHFDRTLVGWEEKGEALTYPLLRQGEREAVFENPERDHPRRFIYRSPNPDTLVVLIEGYTDGELKTQEYRLRREPSP